MEQTMRSRLHTLFLFTVLALPVAAQEPASPGITRDGIRSFLVEEGFDSPTFVEDYPPFDGETYTSAHVPPGINVDMYGPEEGLTHIEARFRATDDSNEQHWQGLLALKILQMAFPTGSLGKSGLNGSSSRAGTRHWSATAARSKSPARGRPCT